VQAYEVDPEALPSQTLDANGGVQGREEGTHPTTEADGVVTVMVGRAASPRVVEAAVMMSSRAQHLVVVVQLVAVGREREACGHAQSEQPGERQRPQSQVGGSVGHGTQHELDGVDDLMHQHVRKLKLLPGVPACV
jgi:hypothetical protein